MIITVEEWEKQVMLLTNEPIPVSTGYLEILIEDVKQLQEKYGFDGYDAYPLNESIKHLEYLLSLLRESLQRT